MLLCCRLCLNAIALTFFFMKVSIFCWLNWDKPRSRMRPPCYSFSSRRLFSLFYCLIGTTNTLSLTGRCFCQVMSSSVGSFPLRVVVDDWNFFSNCMTSITDSFWKCALFCMLWNFCTRTQKHAPRVRLRLGCTSPRAVRAKLKATRSHYLHVLLYQLAEETLSHLITTASQVFTLV